MIGEDPQINIIVNSLMKKTDSSGQFYSLEQPKEQILMRMVSSLGNVDLTRMKSGMMDGEDWARVSGAFGLLTGDIKERLVIDDTSRLTPAMLRVRARRNARRYGNPSIIGLDYLQLMRCPDQENRTQEIAEISRSLQALAKEMACPVVALSQLTGHWKAGPISAPTTATCVTQVRLSRMLTSSSLFTVMRSTTKTPRTRVWLNSSSANSVRVLSAHCVCGLRADTPALRICRLTRGGSHEQHT